MMLDKNSSSNNFILKNGLDADRIQVNAICIGSGRFLRSVLVPALTAVEFCPVVIQTRGTSFMRYLEKRNDMKYEVDTVMPDGSIITELVPVYGAGSLGKTEHKEAVMTFLKNLSKPPRIVGVGVTEAGLTKGSKAMSDFLDMLKLLHDHYDWNEIDYSISVVNTDNIPNNGDVIKDIVLGLVACMEEKDDELVQFLMKRVVFHNSMVDRITSERDDSNGNVPKCEPTPDKALVIEDITGALPRSFQDNMLRSKYGVVVRSEIGQLSSDIALKLRVANGTHTAIAHVMALSSILKTDFLAKEKNDEIGNLFMKYLDRFVDTQIEPAAKLSFGDDIDVASVYNDWRKRLCHAHFGLSTFFITQNGAAKGGIRIGPTIRDLLMSGKNVSFAASFSIAAILRFLTPISSSINGTIFKGWLDREKSSLNLKSIHNDDSVMYADGMYYNLSDGWYEFKCSCKINYKSEERYLCDVLASFNSPRQPSVFYEIVEAYLIAKDGGDLFELKKRSESRQLFSNLVSSVSTLYARMVAGDGLIKILHEINELGFHTECPSLIDGGVKQIGSLSFRKSLIPNDSFLMDSYCLSESEITSVVTAEVSSAEVVDLHTHLLPPSHGILCLWGIDELLTYHYLVAEYFMTAPASIDPTEFYKLTKSEQADIIWQALFIDRSPISEACRGVVTTLRLLGLCKELEDRELNRVRKFFEGYRKRGIEGAEEFCENVFQIAGCKYAIMTNIPFSDMEAQYWRPKPKQYTKRFRSALRVDPFLTGDKATISNTVQSAGYDTSFDGIRKFILDWCETIKPEYMMASTPHNFFVEEGNLAGIKNMGINAEALKDPFAFASPAFNDCDACDEKDVPSAINEESPFLHLLMNICEELDLPLAIKIGAHRQVNPLLREAGDGVVAFADSGMLSRLCSRFPRVRFLATFLSRNNQHEACVLATKFRNLHLYGCWWFCNNPSIIEEITTMRLEMLGTAFTAQHSDARVIDQLIYKWSHSREVIAKALADQYNKLKSSGWRVKRGEIRRDVRRIFGGSYEDFMMKSLK